ncbi:OLC1v1005042C1 [Oldenlandia corymbosa var. corymbosa]|uniref:OLC1v1005042C1 n=1 Tax=Oldenlandia corymbosa var. corymbosa TaxID=529605 RepID=A0AAV1DDS4_OLDCO|nr:OLC1v1005042C1 [Oldenlandia corymbosa var. corymbosa]
MAGELPREASTGLPRTFASCFRKAPDDISSQSSLIKLVSFINGARILEYEDDEYEHLIAPHQMSLVGKFAYGRPKIEDIHKEFKKIGFNGAYTLGLMNPRHVLIRYGREDDYQRCWMRTFWNVTGFSMRILKWKPGFKFEEDPPIVPIWGSLCNLPIEFLNPKCFKIGHKVEDCKKGLSLKKERKGKQQSEEHGTKQLKPAQPSQVVPLRARVSEKPLENVHKERDTAVVGSLSRLTEKEKAATVVDVRDSPPKASSLPKSQQGSITETLVVGCGTQACGIPNSASCNASLDDAAPSPSQPELLGISVDGQDPPPVVTLQVPSQQALLQLENMEGPLCIGHSSNDGTVGVNSDFLESDIGNHACWSEGDMENVLVNDRDKGLFHEDVKHMIAFRQLHSLAPWMIGSDFNVIRTLDEYSGSLIQDLAAISEFNECIHKCDLEDNQAIGEEFTWGGGGGVLAKRDGSDHCPKLHLFDIQLASKSRVFGFQKMWSRRPDFLAIVKHNRDLPLEAFGMLRFSLKLQRLKAKLNEWNKETFGDVFANLKAAEKKVQNLEGVYDTTGAIQDRVRLNAAKAELLMTIKEHDDFWSQKIKLNIEQEAVTFFSALLNDNDIDPLCDEKQDMFVDHIPRLLDNDDENEAMTRRLKALVAQGRVAAYGTSVGSLPVTHLAFADDVIIFSRGLKRSLKEFNGFLMDYEIASGQKVSRPKSSFMVAENCKARRVVIIQRELSIQRGTFPFSYLGYKLYLGRRTASTFQFLLDHLDRRLLSWKNKMLSQGGHLGLIKHVLSSIPVHVFLALPPPWSVILEIEKRCQKFLWRGMNEESQHNWRSLNRITFPVNENGLGIHGFQEFIDALTIKFWWKMKNKTGIWSRFLLSLSTTSKNKTFWKRISKVENRAVVHTKVIVPRGDRSFWFDNWSPHGVLWDIQGLEPPLPDLSIREFFQNRQHYLPLLQPSLSDEILHFLMVHDQVLMRSMTSLFGSIHLQESFRLNPPTKL